MNKQTEHYYTEDPTSLEKEHEFKLILRNKEYKIKTSSGLFSFKKLDNGTTLLIKYMQVRGIVLDLGCGYGPVGLVASQDASYVVFRDINKRACKYARLNIKSNGIRNAKVTHGNAYEGLGEFDTILCYPPMAAGMDVVMKMITQAKGHLSTHGTLQVVARHSKGGARIEEAMKKTFKNVETLAKGGGYRVYISVKHPAR